MAEAGFGEFSAFVAARQRSLVRAAVLLTGDRHRAEDLVQDALVKLALRWHVVGSGYPEAYARQVMYRDSISWRRRHWREDLTEHQTAQILGVSVGTVKSQTHAALRRLRDLAPELRRDHIDRDHSERSEA